ncbi:MFS transporter [Microbispora sp. CA-102843]|uniref:MFS transporter n=1 Tax=Microbispora sp. CA-102843 TaxID=3239952 RepID=UPI003D91FD9A
MSTRRGRVVAIWTAVGLAGGASGNLLSGALTGYLTWRSTLLINVPIGAVAAALAVAVLPGAPVRARTGRLDVAGAGVGHVRPGGADLWSDVRPRPRLGRCRHRRALVTALAALAAFVAVEARWAREPLVPPRLFRSRAIWLGNLEMLLAGAAFQIPMWYFLTLYLQQVLGLDALRTGLAFLPHTLVMLVVGLRLTPWLMRRVGTRPLVVAGALVAAAGFAWQSRITADDTYISAVLGPGIALAVGGGLLTTPLTVVVTSGVPSADAGAASGLMNTAKQTGGVLGLAALVALTGRHSGTAQATVAGYGRAFAITAVVLVVVAVLGGVLPNRRDGRSATASTDPRTAGA